MKNKPKIALVGSRGIPPRYGGAETFVYELSKRLKDHFDVYVTCESDYFGIDEYEGIKRVHIWAKHTPTTTIPIIYDIIATLYLLKKVKDIRVISVSYTHLRAHETRHDLVCRLLLEKKN